MQIAELSPRLEAIRGLISTEYDHIWDCCCDHGKLGFSLLNQAYAPNIHFVDIVPELIDAITTQLESASVSAPISALISDKPSAPSSQGIAHCLDAAKLPLARYNGRHLVVLAGIGGELSKQLITHLYAKHRDRKVDYLLCPIRQLYTLRTELNKQQFVLKAERLVEDKGRFYEVMLVTGTPETGHPFSPVSQVGRHIWTASNAQEQAIAEAYLDQLITHYTRMQHSQKPEVSAILQAYRKVSIQLDS